MARQRGSSSNEGLIGIIARFVAEITLSRVWPCGVKCSEHHITCLRNTSVCFETARIMRTNKGTSRKSWTDGFRYPSEVFTNR